MYMGVWGREGGGQNRQGSVGHYMLSTSPLRYTYKTVAAVY